MNDGAFERGRGSTGVARRTSPRSFTTLELLVGISLIAVMVALVFPALKNARDRATSTQCMNNFRQIGVGMMLYTSDYGHFPYSGHLKQWNDWGEELIPFMDPVNQWVLETASWATGLKRSTNTGWYLAHETGQGIVTKAGRTVIRPGYNYFTCPAVNSVSNSDAPPWDGTTVHRYAHHYSCNEYLMPWGFWGNSPVNYTNETNAEIAYNNGTYVSFPAVKPQELERPGSLIMICETGIYLPDYESYDTISGPVGVIISDFDSNPLTASSRGANAVTTIASSDNDTGGGAGWPVYCRHNGRCHALMADGHVQQFRNGEIQRRNFVSHGRTRNWGADYRFIEAYYP